MNKLSHLIEALAILLKYGDPEYPTHCEHGVLMVYGIDPCKVSNDDKEKLDGLGFFVTDADGAGEHFRSFRFGSC